MVGLYRWSLLTAVLATMGVGCFPDADGEAPDLASAYIYYPVGVALTQPASDYLLVANSNFDLLYNAGSVVPLQLEPIREVLRECRECFDEGGEQCCPEFIVPSEGEAEDSTFEVRDFVLEEHAVRTGSYASTISVTEGLALLPVRSDASVHFIDVDEVPSDELGQRRVLRCAWGERADEPGDFQRCGSRRRVSSGERARDGASIGLPADPYGIIPWTDEENGNEFSVVGHMVGGEISLFRRFEQPNEDDLPGDCTDGDDDDGDGLMNLDDPGCQGASISLVDVDNTFNEGSTGLAADHDGRLLVTSRFNASVTAFRVGESMISPVRDINVDIINPGDNQRGVAISPDGQLAYIASRSPESILVLDIAHDDYGNYVDRFVDVVEIGSGPSIVRIHSDPSYSEGYVIYAVCFEEDRIFVIDPAVNEAFSVITTRRGPHELIFDSELKVGYLVNFLESTVSVLDVDPGSPTYHQILTTLGRPKRPRTND